MKIRFKIPSYIPNILGKKARKHIFNFILNSSFVFNSILSICGVIIFNITYNLMEKHFASFIINVFVFGFEYILVSKYFGLNDYTKHLNTINYIK